MVSHTFYHILEEAVLLFYTMPVVPQHFKQICEMQFLLSLLLQFPRTLEKILSPKSWIKIFASPTSVFAVFLQFVLQFLLSLGQVTNSRPHANKQAGPEAAGFAVVP